VNRSLLPPRQARWGPGKRVESRGGGKPRERGRGVVDRSLLPPRQARWGQGSAHYSRSPSPLAPHRACLGGSQGQRTTSRFLYIPSTPPRRARWGAWKRVDSRCRGNLREQVRGVIHRSLLPPRQARWGPGKIVESRGGGKRRERGRGVVDRSLLPPRQARW
jgi:hypothetical protein